MPVSDYHQISDVLHVIEQINPATILDVGVGFGKWGILCREILEVYKGRVHPSSWTVQIEGIEIYEPYRNPLWKLAYNHVHIGDALAVLDRIGRYDLIICCDVIEHFDKESGQLLLRKMCDHAEIVVLTSPRGFHAQGAIYQNSYETHRSGWHRKDLKSLAHRYKDIGFTFLAVMSSDERKLTHIALHDPFEVLGARRATRRCLGFVFERGWKRLLQHSA